MAELRLYLFGSPRLEREEQPVKIDTWKALALLAYLALNAHEHSREALATMFWPEQNDEQARSNLRRALWTLRQVLPTDALSSDKQHITLRPAMLVVDVLQFQSLVAAASTAQLQTAVDLYAADFLTGFTLPDCPAFDEWQFFTAERLRRTLGDVLQRLIQECNVRQEYATALEYAQHWLALDTLHEPAHRLVMQLYAWNGQQAAALRQYEECRRLLEQELGVAPDDKTTALYATIRNHRLAPPTAQGAAPIQALVTPLLPPTRYPLPAPSTPLLGRTLELAELDLLMFDCNERLITITGPGGMGKTHLALAVAKRHQTANRFRDGICFVSLATINDAQAILPELVSVLGLVPTGNHAAEGLKRQMLDFLASKHMLLIFDNFEHVLAGCALLAEILTFAPEVYLLVTSRERLYLHDEQVYPLRGLECPLTVADQEAPALTLFLRTAQRTYRHFQPNEQEQLALVQICQLTEGMPLALELAASWSHLVTPLAMARTLQTNLDLLESTLHDVPPRHHSIRAAFTTTWTLLTENERQIFARLSVFRGGFTRAAAQQVAGATLKQLNALANKSLLEYQRAEDRYTIHELLRQFAAEKLQTTGEGATTEQRHLEFFVRLAEAAAARITTPAQQEGLKQLKHEYANLRIAMIWALAHQEEALAIRLGGALGRFWFIRGPAQEGIEFLAQIRTLFQATGRQIALDNIAKVYDSAGWLAFLQGEYARAALEFEQALTLARRANDQKTVASALRGLAWQVMNQGNRDFASQLAQQSLDVARLIGDDWLSGAALNVLGELARTSGEYQRAASFFTDSQALLRRAGDISVRVHVQFNAGWVAHALHKYERARAIHREGLTLACALGDMRAIASGLEAIASTVIHLPQSSQVEWALRLLGAAEALRTSYGIPLEDVDRPDYDNLLARAHTVLDPATFTAVWAEGYGMSLEQAIVYALEKEPDE